MMHLKELYFITGNKDKLAEVNCILGNIVQLKNHAMDLIEIQGTIEAISVDKCKRASLVVSILPTSVEMRMQV